ncbi:methyltransferase, FkbM family [Singulisphaera sp. GP187]|uniref:FkbM family methyltransferase n=1 Tax=Singulisphaera sp. GP187 TaxID=1882752 RepID=UPI00092B33BF|nr:FkbM family methyltransferase [Singulisphaera sp. GP187]SIO55145.1 methyltransferase, FkbM family [Singulisphaera sp. GP187]
MSPEVELEALLNTDPESVLDFERHGFDRVAAPYAESLVLFGAGNLGRMTLAKLRQIGIEPLAFADNAKPVQGTKIDGIDVLSPADAVARYHDRATFVTTIWGAVPREVSANRLQKHLRSQLERLGCQRIANFTALYCKYPDAFLPYFAIDLPSRVLGRKDEIRRAFRLMADEASRREFVAQVRHRLFQDFDGLPPAVEEEQYFCDSLFASDPHEVFVDCGAFDGDTLKVFLERKGDGFDHYYALEPDPLNFEKLRAYVETLPTAVAARISALPLASSDRRTKTRIDPSGLASSRIGQGSVEVDCVPLDELLAEHVPTTIKMDVEGAEFETLKGARGLIQAHSPLLNVCVYHTQDHLWVLPLLIQSMNPDYHYYLRPHKNEVFDLVCYAVPKHRLVLVR